MFRRSIGRPALLATLAIVLPSCTNEGDNITYETPAATAPASGTEPIG